MASYRFTLTENEDGSSTAVAVGTVSAADPNGELVTYSIEAGDPGGVFAISSTGAITYVGSGENYEAFADPAKAFILTVRASDVPAGAPGPQSIASADVPVTVSVADVLDAPAVTAAWISDSPGPGPDNTYREGDVVRVGVAWDQQLAVTGAPRLALTIGSATKHADYDADTSRPQGLGSVGTLVFTYTVALGDSDTDGIAVPGPVDLNGRLDRRQGGHFRRGDRSRPPRDRGRRVPPGGPPAPTWVRSGS